MRQRARRHTQATRLFSYVARWLGEGQEVLWRRLGERGTGPGAGLADRGPKEGGLWPTVTRGKEGAGGGGFFAGRRALAEGGKAASKA